MSDERLLSTFLDLVRIDSPSGSERVAAEYCRDALEAAGCRVWFDDAAEKTGSDVGNLIALLPGELPGTLALSAHLDVVEPCRGIEPVVTEGIVHSAGPTVLGADDRAGLAAAIEVVRRVAESGAPGPTLRIIFTVQEEVGLHGAKHLRPEDVACDLCLVLDADGAPGGIVVGAPTHYTFTARFLGRACHAGVAPEAGVSAITMAAHAIASMELGRLDERTTANVGSIRGGRATNVVTAQCDITGECRSLDSDRVEQVKADMDRAMRDAAERFGGQVELDWNLEYEGFVQPEEGREMSVVVSAMCDAGLAPWTYLTGGGSDANVLAAMGIPTLALACGMSGVHGTAEQIEVADLNALARVCVAAAVRLGESGVS
ncbi:MAG: M20/M25/M40 family metallo-hydrolase [Coriobacteriia bacterium]|nr:M20/M25/M40 family metallo-hydrolase [Coriobacteriia bacterium]